MESNEDSIVQQGFITVEFAVWKNENLSAITEVLRRAIEEMLEEITERTPAVFDTAYNAVNS